MAIPLDGDGGLFPRLGRIFGAMALCNAQRGGAMGTAFDGVAADFADDPAIVDGLYRTLAAHRAAAGGVLGGLRTLAESTLVAMVDDDNPLPDLQARTALEELVRQMEAASATVSDASPSAVVSADPGNVGDVEVVASVVLAGGRKAERSLAEDVVAEVTADGQPGGGATAGRERLRLRGERAADALSWEWPLGSGSGVTLTAVDAADDAQGGTGNWTSNGDFAGWTSGIPDGWEVDEGSVSEDSSSGFDEATALALAGDGSSTITVYQEFGSSSGSRVEVGPSTQLAFCLRLKADVVPASGTLRVALVDGDGTVLQDGEGNASSSSIDLAAIGTSYQARTGALRTPPVVPSVVRLQLSTTTPIASGSTVLVDEVALTRMTPLYAGGPSVAAFSGATPAIRGDRWTIAVSNAAQDGFQAWFDRALGTRALGILLPSSATPTIDDAAITSDDSSGA